MISIIKNIKKENWKYLILGLQKTLKLTQKDLLKKIKIEHRQNCMSKWINGRRIPSKNSQNKVVRFIIKNNLDINKLIKLGEKFKNSIEFNNKLVSIKNSLEKDHFEKNLIIKINNKKYLNTPFLFPKYRNKQLIKFIQENNNLLVFYKYKYANNLKALLLPKYLEFNENLLVGMGLYLAEGAKNRHPKITNSESLIINKAIKFFKLFNFQTPDFKAWIQLHERSNKPSNQVIKYWIENTNLNQKNIKKLRIKKSTGNAKVKQNGTLHLEISSILFQLLINNLLKFIPNIIEESSKQQQIWFLQGAYAGEGSVEIAKSGSVNNITYTSTKKEERILIKKILNKLKIKVNENNKYSKLSIFGYENIEKLNKINIFRYHPLRKEKLENGSICLRKNPLPNFHKNKILDLLKNNKNLSSLKVAKRLNISHKCAHKHLTELYIKNKVNKTHGFGSTSHKWFI